MQRCETQKPILDQLVLHDCHQNHHLKNSDLMYKKLQTEHLLLQRSFASVCHSLNESLSKCQSNNQFISNIVFNKNYKTKCQLKRQMSLINCKLLEDNEILPPQQLNMPSIPVIIHKKLCKEHVILQQSFATVCQSLKEILERDSSQRPKQHISNSQQKKCNKKEFDELRRQIELLSIELQETRDQNELLEFRIHEFEHIKTSPKSQTPSKSSFNGKTIDYLHRFNEISCSKCCELETQLLDVNHENQKLNDKLNATQQTLNELIAKYALKEELNHLLLQRNYTQNTVTDKNSYIGSAMTSEDEGLGDDTRRDHSSGPSSLADLQESEFDAISQKSTQSASEINDKDLPSNVCSSDIESIKSVSPTLQQSSESVDKTEKYLRLEVIKSNDLIEKLKQSLEELKQEKANLEEQVLELEEAENDSRLMSQRLQQQMQTFMDDYEKLELDFIKANKTIDLNNNRIKSFETIETDLRYQIEELRNILLKQFLIENNCNRNEKRLDRSDTIKNFQLNNDLFNKIPVFDNKEKKSEQHLTQVDGLYSVVWEKLYRLDNQIDCLKQSYSESNQMLYSQDNDDDLQLFISAEKLSEGVSKIGCSFEASQFDTSRDEPYNHCEASVRLDDLVLSMPLCEAIKPERIDVMISNTCHSKNTAVTSMHVLSPDLTNKLSKLEINELQLRERLVQLEWINKEFVHELELREKIFFEREKNQSDWTNSENEFKYTMNELKNEMKSLQLKEHDLETQINNLSENIVSICKKIDEKNRKQEIRLKDITNDRNNSLIDLKRRETQLESEECQYQKLMTQSIDSQKFDSPEIVEDVTEKYEQIIVQLTKQRELISKVNEDYSTKIDPLVNSHKCSQTKLKLKLQELDNQKLSTTKEMEIICDKKTILTNLLTDKENNFKKMRNTYENRLKILLEEHKLVEKELKMKMKEMEGQTSSTVNQLENERYKIIKQLNEGFGQIKHKDLEFKTNINNLNEKTEKIEAKIQRLVKNKSNLDELENEKKKLKIEMNSIHSCEDELKRKLNEMMQKESAYEKTLSEADKIIATLEHNYKKRIDELETSKTKLKLRVTQLEESEARLRSSVRPDRRATNDSYGKASDLVKQLIDCEARECSLRQQIKTLETSVNQLQQQLDDSNHMKQRIESELKDQDELVTTVNHLQRQIDSLKSDLTKSLQSQDSLQDMLKETEKYYQQRDEDLQSKYKSLEDEKCFLEITIQELRHRLKHFQQDIDNPDSFIDNNENTTNDNREPKDLNEINNQELDNATDNMNKCFKRAIAVVKLEMKEKDNLWFGNTKELVSSRNSCYSLSSSEDGYQTNQTNIEDLMGERNESLSSYSSSTSSISSQHNITSFEPNFCNILEKVSYDSLLIGWQFNNHKDISGYQILVNDQIVNKVQNANTCQALVNNLDLSKSFTIKIKSISYCHQKCDEAVTQYEAIPDPPVIESIDESNQITRL